MQFYETTIYNDELTASFSVLTIPRRSLVDEAGFFGAAEIEGMIGLQKDEVQHAVLRMLLAAATDRSLAAIPDGGAYSFAGMTGHRELIPFSEYLFHEASIPFEQSPLAGISLDKILKATPATIGAAAGFVAAGSHGPLLLISVPAGIILCITAKEVGSGLGEGLKHRIVKALTGKAPIKSGKKRVDAKRADPSGAGE